MKKYNVPAIDKAMAILDLLASRQRQLGTVSRRCAGQMLGDEQARIGIRRD